MTAPLFLLEPGALDGLTAGASFTLDGAEGRHAATVQRLAPGELLLLADGAGLVATATVTAREQAALHLYVDVVERQPPPEPRFVLVQALAKGDRDEQAIEAATELGVDEVVPWQAERSVVVWRGDRADRAHAKWRKVVRAAAKQSRRARVPEVAPHARLRDVIPRLEAATLALVLHEDATEPLAGVELPDRGEVVVVVGPEGGITDTELAACTQAGARPVRLGHTVLRSSSAGPAALAVLSAAARWR
ncbi:MAG TPA: 16S rRNA (uracil(1498)-N(3))-methyltransferase [Segeticoccus sp.]|uniref:16S rRNA (uracil(1498)-N(3))-methyltransferase n=1 Tax=Segeticoccus sp. TaxID=2706531 RepID=UPI002D7F7605|nr:16S rRNA (uracil(1498)-N(3))-methyltransferase [Segeticoccus sp.]HET8599586.1 16S rRNA (uracil(1498)-N(3))-methyltransferase [Segeticoccus sp.]